MLMYIFPEAGYYSKLAVFMQIERIFGVAWKNDPDPGS